MASGLGLLEAAPTLRRRPWPTRLAIAYLLGLAFVPFLLFTLSHVARLPLSREASWAAFLLPALGGAALRACRRAPVPAWRPSEGGNPRPPLLPRASLVAASAIPAVVGAALLAEALTNPLGDWDGRMTWFAHARWMRAARDVTPPALADGRYFAMHPRYPPGLPLAQVAAQQALALSDDERLVRPLYAVTFLAFVAVLLDAAARRAGLWAGVAVALLASVTPALTFHSHGGPAGGYSDFPLAALWGSGLLLLTERRLPMAQAFLGGLLLAGAVLTKNEGLPLSACALSIFLPALVLRPSRPRTLGPLLAAALPAILAAILLSSWRAGLPDRLDERYSLPAGPVELLSRLGDRLPAVASLAVAEMGPSGAWGPVAPAAAAILLLGLRGLFRPAARTLLLPLAAALLVYLAAYAVTPWDLAELVRTTWTRFLTQLALPGLVLVAAALREALRPPAFRRRS